MQCTTCKCELIMMSFFHKHAKIHHGYYSENTLIVSNGNAHTTHLGGVRSMLPIFRQHYSYVCFSCRFFARCNFFISPLTFPRAYQPTIRHSHLALPRALPPLRRPPYRPVRLCIMPCPDLLTARCRQDPTSRMALQATLATLWPLFNFQHKRPTKHLHIRAHLLSGPAAPALPAHAAGNQTWRPRWSCPLTSLTNQGDCVVDCSTLLTPARAASTKRRLQYHKHRLSISK